MAPGIRCRPIFPGQIFDPMKWLKRLSLFLAALYLVLCAVLFFAQESLIFHPDPLAEDYVFESGEEVELPVDEGISLNCLWIKTPQPKGVILYLHGNKGSNRRCLHQAQTMTGNGFDIFMPDYRGFGKSEGQIVSEAQLLADAQKAYDFLRGKYPESKIVLVGYSLGSGMASQLAANNHPQQLILLAPYWSMTDLKDRLIPIVPDFVLKYHLESGKALQAARLPITLFHGTLDEVIPFDCSEKLQALRPASIRLVRLEGEGHRGVIFSDLFRNTVAELLH